MEETIKLVDIAHVTADWRNAYANAKTIFPDHPEVIAAADELEKAHAALIRANDDYNTVNDNYKNAFTVPSMFKVWFQARGPANRVQREVNATLAAYCALQNAMRAAAIYHFEAKYEGRRTQAGRRS